MGYAVADGHVRFHIAGMSGKKLGTTRRQTRCQEIAWKLLYQSDVRGLALFLYFGDAITQGSCRCAILRVVCASRYIDQALTPT